MSKSGRNQKGSAIAEFGGALLIFVCFFLAPVIDLSFIPARYLITNGVVTEVTHRLSLSEKRSSAYSKLTTDSWWTDILNKCGVVVHDPELTLIIVGKDSSDKLIVQQGVVVPSNWLPGGDKGPCIYSLELSLKADIPPLFSGGSAGLPGFTSPIVMGFNSRSQWENLGCDPQTGEFYINE